MNPEGEEAPAAVTRTPIFTARKIRRIWIKPFTEFWIKPFTEFWIKPFTKTTPRKTRQKWRTDAKNAALPHVKNTLRGIKQLRTHNRVTY